MPGIQEKHKIVFYGGKIATGFSGKFDKKVVVVEFIVSESQEFEKY